jgi:Holliday junction resolvase RusA-like endonuclease
MIVITGINPEPWDLGTISTGRRKSGGISANMSPNAKLVAYKNALREELTKKKVVKLPDDSPVSLVFYFLREIEVYQGPRKTTYGHVADATNLQKATEDALQGILFDNDSVVHDIHSTILGQATGIEPGIIIHVTPYIPDPSLYLWAIEQLGYERARFKIGDNSW